MKHLELEILEQIKVLENWVHQVEELREAAGRLRETLARQRSARILPDDGTAVSAENTVGA